MQIIRLSDLALLASEDRYSLQSTVDVAVQLLRVPMALISVVETHNDRQIFLAHRGLSAPYDSTEESSLDLCLCKDVIANGEPLSIDDTAADPKYRDHPAVETFGLRSYMGFPVFGPFDMPFAALSVADTAPRVWEERDKHILGYLARQTTRYMQGKAEKAMERSGIKPPHILIE
ncbi:MAG: GAF domain-containing protein [Rhodobacteraceae bacterium]|jgi:GAF domain-containing protein|uniref:GAF domain-containing protein n=1 Tax=Salipiger profundus TaxID=1229727 RepID=A0A1U7D1P8_9RHOB|nr:MULTISPECIES: GAF domain-containing protein [Salipiger]APX22052.1 GAF domain-containing protein [Salipiger profundus]MAB08222.1 GAF domain-containing protein [Paracoccaceae bacterium]GGA07192.1 hypothetical protein GCM10011326_18700 [Salipiger profundus]SFC42875.1 hypothetical protein SAMN05444415_103238 [Salipiger profundus]